MAELKDYSGEFNPKIRYQDFSKDALAGLLTEYAWMNMCLDGWWRDIVKEKRGRVVWGRGIPHWQTRTMKALNIQGNDVAACIKTLQMDPGMCFNIFDLSWELEDGNYGLLTIRDCPAVNCYESADETTKLAGTCQMDLEAFNRVAKSFNPGMEVTALALPPRKGKDDICCRFEFRLEPEMPTGAQRVEVAAMSELADYSGEFNPKIRYQDFSKDALARLVTEYARLGLRLDGWWQDSVREKCGEREAIEYEKAVWERGTPYWQMRTMKALNIQGNDVAACIKALQMDPQLCFNVFDIEWEMRDGNHGTYTVRNCHAVRYFEGIEDMATLVHMCQLDWDAYRKIAQFFNPDMEVVALALPPRKSPDEIACKFEFRLESKTSMSGING
ncbi:DUF6125 family protein [Chloroflexota bacterium]